MANKKYGIKNQVTPLVNKAMDALAKLSGMLAYQAMTFVSTDEHSIELGNWHDEVHHMYALLAELAGSDLVNLEP